MNSKYIKQFHYTFIINSQKSIQNISVATDERPSPKLVLREGGMEKI